MFPALYILSCMCFFALSYRSFCIFSSDFLSSGIMFSSFANVFSDVSRLTITSCFFSMSRGPSSILIGIPLSSHSLYLNPALYSSRSSSITVYPSFSRFSFISLHLSIVSFFVLSNIIGTMTICVGAIFGGSTSPLSSECIIISAPIMRVVTPHEVCQTYFVFSSSSMNFMSNAFAKFCPRQCDVPIWSAFLSGMSASSVVV